MNKLTVVFKVLVLIVALSSCSGKAGKIDREALVKRHTVTLDSINAMEIAQVGNGEIAFGIDPTGLQTFYGNTMSQWGWHTKPYPDATSEEEVYHPHHLLKLQEYAFHGGVLPLRTSPEGQRELYNWMRENPHRFNLGRLSFIILKKDGLQIQQSDVKDIKQTINLWNGTIDNRYTIEGVDVHVRDCMDPTTGALSVKVKSALIKEGRMMIEWAFPYGHHGTSGSDWTHPELHTTKFLTKFNNTKVIRQLDDDRYYAEMEWNNAMSILVSEHKITLTPSNSTSDIEFSVCYSPVESEVKTTLYREASKASAAYWKKFWTTGGAVDLSKSKDPRWKELERRIVLSQYQLAVNEAGSLPPQESGLYNNSGWNGKFHLEMHFWHAAHYALWGRLNMFEPSLKYYRDALPKARELAATQGFKGARFVKMSGPDNEDSPSGTGPHIIWQQPHPIFYAELEYRINPSKEVLEKWQSVVQETAEFMADFAKYEPAGDRYVLGPPISTVPENTKYTETMNPAFELSYWRTGLRLAQTWRERLGLPRDSVFDKVLAKLSELPVAEGVYLSQENMPDTYTEMNWEHPSLIGPNGVLPPDGTDPATARRTLEKVWQTWQFDRCWGWDFPMVAMSAARNGRPDIAVDALLHPSFKNDINKAGLSTGGPFPYYPTNGALLYAVALMCAGWDGAPEGVVAPGFPADGSWTVRYEGLDVAP